MTRGTRLTELHETSQELTSDNPLWSAILSLGDPAANRRLAGDHAMSEAAGAETPRGPAMAHSMSPRQDPVAPQIGVVGLGRMGAAFAKYLPPDGYRVNVFDLSQAKRQLLGAIGAL